MKKRIFSAFVMCFLLISINIASVYADEAGSIKMPYGVGQTIETYSQRYNDSPQVPYTVRVDSSSMGSGAEKLAKKVYGESEYNLNHKPSSTEQWVILKIYIKNKSGDLTLNLTDVYNDIYGLQLYDKKGNLISGQPANIRREYTFTNLTDINDLSSKKDSLAPGESTYVWCGAVISKTYGTPLFRVMTGVDESSYVAMRNYIYINLDESVKYSINYVLNGGKNNIDNPKYFYSYGEVVLKNPTRTGYSFQGWYSDKAMTKKVTTISKNSKGDKTLYAKWKAIQYNIKYDGNGATGTKMTPSEGVTYDKTFILKNNTYTRSGYIFAGWNTKKNGSGKNYTNKASVKNLTSTKDATVTLYAQWTNVYSISFNGNGASDGKMSAINDCKYGNKIVLPASKYKRNGYKFAGWNTKKDGTGISYKDGATVRNLTKGNKITLYAQWKKVSYKITYVCNYGKNNSKNPSSYTYGNSIALAEPQRDGYTFVGWYRESSFKTKVTSITKKTTGNITLYAKWIVTPATIRTISYNDYVVIDWERNPLASKYEVYRSTNKNSGYKKIMTVVKGASYKDDIKLTDGKIYYYKVRLVIENGNKTSYSSYSNIGIAKKAVIPRVSARLLNEINTNTSVIEIQFGNYSNRTITVKGYYGAYLGDQSYVWNRGTVWSRPHNHYGGNGKNGEDLIFRPGINYNIYIGLENYDTVSNKSCASFIFECDGMEYLVTAYKSGTTTCGAMWK